MAMKPFQSTLSIALTVLVIGLWTTDVLAQSRSASHPSGASLVGDVKTTATLEWMRPALTESDGTKFLTSAVLIGGQVEVTPNLAIAARLPITHLGLTGTNAESSTDIGNVYLGGRYAPSVSNLQVEIGAYIPVGGADAFDSGIVGYLSDFDRLEAYLPETFSLLGRAAYVYRHDSGFRLEGIAGPSVLIYTGELEEDGTDLHMHYGTRGWYDAGKVSVGAGLSGAANLTVSDADLGERTVHQGALYVAGNTGSVRPHAYIRLPLDDSLSEVVDFIFGAGVAVAIP